MFFIYAVSVRHSIHTRLSPAKNLSEWEKSLRFRDWM